MPEDDEKKKRPMILRRISPSSNEKNGAKKQDEVLRTRVIQKEGQRPIVIKQVQPPEIKIYGAAHVQKLTLGQSAADGIAKWGGSWWFISIFMVLLFIWMIINFFALTHVWDPYPFILLNLVLSCLAAIQAPIILMSQNRAAERDRAKAERDYAVNRRSEKEIENIQDDLDHIKRRLADILCRLPEKPRKR
jgi:uncharacterized membrane protein